jgi:hypothetical protein
MLADPLSGPFFSQGLLPAVGGSALSGYFRLEQPRRMGYLAPEMLGRR